MTLRVFRFSIQLNYGEFLPYYQGEINRVEVRSHQGQVLWVHARHLRRFLTSNGIRGTFEIQIDENGRLLSLNKLC
ncbi:DUF2835 domain-containing protein [Shewanella sp. NIFS-20-20]|uniref:DUF2835 domain-containing protein n=1 Tax=Shewanella sp. NIFS-20-20 TaxID=2853806 RepID=UPI001C485205|nr:DUF2835 domain-containing protein [Shewanella sp. NIFS-20-20]MBV7314612.1 DUF2835 domain-containing protein [Shewanella sp. NIFS-20-20]